MTVAAIAFEHTLQSLLTTHTLLVVAALIFFEELGIPSPVPGDLMMIVAGIAVAQGTQRLDVVLLVELAATIAGASILYGISRRVGRPFVARHGHLIHLTPARLAAVEARVRRHGARAVAAGRLIPGLRIVTPIAVGVLGEPYLVFLPGLAIGGSLYVIALTLAGYFIGPAALDLFEQLSPPVGALCSLAVFALLAYVARRGRGALSDERAVVLGMFAGVMALLATDALVGLLGFVFRLVGDAAAFAATGIQSGWRLLLGWPAFLVAASVLGVVYHVLRLHRLPAWARVALYALPPFVLALLVMYPIGANESGSAVARAGWALIAVEAVRWGIFGVALDLLTGSPLTRRDESDVSARTEGAESLPTP